MSEKNYHHGDLRSALIAAARVILERDGLAALSLRACAREASVSHAAPLHHFHSLAELQAAVAASGFDDFVQFLDERAASESIQTAQTARLIAMGRAYVRFSTLHPALYRLMFGIEGPHVESPILETASIAAWNQLHNAVIAASGPERSTENAMFIWSVVHGHAMLIQSGCVPPIVDIDQQLEVSLAAISRSLDVGKD